MICFVDFETRSLIDLPDTGVYPYAEHESTDIWLMAYAFDDEEPELWLPSSPPPRRLVEHIHGGGALHAWNAQFERLIWRYKMGQYGWEQPCLDQWHCTMARAAGYGLPLKLEQAAQALVADHQKDMDGHRLMMQMSRPRRMEDGKPVWWHDSDKLTRLGVYCKQDVRTERAIHQKLEAEPSPRERRVWLLDQEINDRGVGLDVPLIVAAKGCAEEALDSANARLEEITEGEVTSVNEVVSLSAWLNKHTPCDSVAKPAVEDMLSRDLPPAVAEVLMLRKEAGKSSVAKLESMLSYRASDDRAHGLLQYMGASTTGRWAGRGIQPQNFPRGSVKDVERFIPLIMAYDVARVRQDHPVMEVISSMLRSMFVAKPGHRFITMDYNAIEARVLAWLAGQADLVELFRSGGRVYEDMAATIFGVSASEIVKGSKERHVGKEAVLGLGYQMGWSKFQMRCASQAKVDLSDDQAREAVTAYRAKNDQIVSLWRDMEQGALSATNLKPVKLRGGKIQFFRVDDWLVMRLPSKRTLKYFQPRVVVRDTPWGTTKECVQITGMNSVTRQWETQYLYGGLLVENAVQAIARDLLADAMLALDAAEYPIVLTVHDEVVMEPENGFGSKEDVERIMQTVPSWAEGCPVTVEGWEGERYRK